MQPLLEKNIINLFRLNYCKKYLLKRNFLKFENFFHTFLKKYNLKNLFNKKYFLQMSQEAADHENEIPCAIISGHCAQQQT